MRFAKILRFGRTRTNVGIDLYNIFNTNTGTTFNQNFGTDGATYRQEVTLPQSAVPPLQRDDRLLKAGKVAGSRWAVGSR